MNSPRIELAKFKENWAPKELVALARQSADDSFTAGISCGAIKGYLPKLPPGFFYSENSGVLLKVKNVSPHDDSPVGDLVESWRGSTFCVLTDPGPNCYLQVGLEHLKLQKGDWVMFDDRILHSLQSTKTLLGLSIQLGSAKSD